MMHVVPRHMATGIIRWSVHKQLSEPMSFGTHVDLDHMRMPKVG